MTGIVHLVGAGPGDPDLLTVKAHRILQAGDIVLHDRLVGDGVLQLIPDETRKIPVGKRPGEGRNTQQRILHLMVLYACDGHTVVRLKGGDPFVYGRGSEEWEHLSRRGIPVEVTPGLTSALSVPALAGIPLTHRGIASSFAVTSGHLSDGTTQDWSAYAAVDTLVVLMGVSNRAQIAAALISEGRPGDQPAAVIERGTTPRERVVTTTLAELAAGLIDVHPPALLIIGDVVSMRQRVRMGDGPSLLPRRGDQASLQSLVEAAHSDRPPTQIRSEAPMAATSFLADETTRVLGA